MITITFEHNQARLQGTKTFIDTGATEAVLCLYATARVADTVDAGPPLATIPLAYPCGEVTANGLELAASGDGLINSTGDALWGRIFNRAGQVALSADVKTVDDPPETEGELVIGQRTLFAGGIVRLISGVLE